MEKLTETALKVPSLDQQIKFVQDKRRLLENNPDAEILWEADSVEQLRAVEMSLVALKKCEEISQALDIPILEAAIRPREHPRCRCSLPVGTSVQIEIGTEKKTEWVQGNLHHYNDNGNPVVMTYYGMMKEVFDHSKIEEVSDGE